MAEALPEPQTQGRGRRLQPARRLRGAATGAGSVGQSLLKLERQEPLPEKPAPAHQQAPLALKDWQSLMADGIMCAMSSTTMSFALPEVLREYVDQRVRSGQYGNTSECLREPIRRDQEEQAKKRLRELIEEGLSSGPGRAPDTQVDSTVEEAGAGRPALKPAHLRPRAEAGLIEAARCHAQERGLALGERMFDAAIAALEPIERMPSMGSPRLGQMGDIPDLRSWRVAGFPMQWLCFEAPDHLDGTRRTRPRAIGTIGM